MDNVAAKVKWNPDEAKSLFKYEDCLQVSGQFSYSSVVGILMYLAGHTSSYIAYAVNFSAIYMFRPRHFHSLLLKRVGYYLKATRYKVLVLNPSSSLFKVDWFIGANFLRMHGHEDLTYSSCVKTRTGFLITFVEFPVHCKSKLHTETFLSTMEAKFVSLEHICCGLFHIFDIGKDISRVVRLSIGDTTIKNIYSRG